MRLNFDAGNLLQNVKTMTREDIIVATFSLLALADWYIFIRSPHPGPAYNGSVGAWSNCTIFGVR
jgi:hypothetical protein